MYERLFELPLDSTESFFVFGPRGTGKTSWLKAHLTGEQVVYVDLLEGSTFRKLTAEPESLALLIPASFSGWVVIDEVQRVPAVLDEVHRLIESKKIRFILTGSSARKLRRVGVNLLAGRAIKYTMHPLIPDELGDDFLLPHALQYGMLPATYSYDDPEGYLKTYVETYLREEVMQEGLTRNVSAFSRFLEVACFSQGATVNMSSVAKEVQASRKVIENYFSILEDLLIAHWLPVFSKRAKRRLVTSEKFYYFDVGVYNHLRPRGLFDRESEVAGVGLETLFFQTVMALNNYKRLAYQICYWKTATGLEVDFVLYGTDKLFAFEIKHSKSIQAKSIRGLKAFKADYPMAECYVFYLGGETLHLADGITAVPFEVGVRNLLSYL